MPSQAEVAILFADIVGSTKLYDQFGNERARKIVRRCLTAMMEVTGRHGGRLVEIVGDEVYTTFSSVDAAMAAAVDMQESITGTMTVDGKRLAIHIGLHFGPVLIEANGDLYGDAVNVAHRMVNQAKGGQILTTGQAVAVASAQWHAGCRLIGYATLKGKRESIEVYELVWRGADATLMRRVAPSVRNVDSAALLTFAAGPETVELTGDHPTLTIGRGDENDVVLAHAIVSRLHAWAECRNGRIILTDQSANGTYVVPDGGPVTFVHNDDYVLAGSGTLGLGEAPAPGSATAIRYKAVVRMDNDGRN